MNYFLRIPLQATQAQNKCLEALQALFTQVCNALAPTVQQTRTWNRVALHHLMYRTLRERFPELGSQMVCNAIYSVSRTARLLFQHPDSSHKLSRLNDAPLPLIRFGQNCPVYFDRHTLSVKDGQLSMFTLDGRMRFALALKPADEALFQHKKLREIVLKRKDGSEFELAFLFSDKEDEQALDVRSTDGAGVPAYVTVEEAT